MKYRDWAIFLVVLLFTNFAAAWTVHIQNPYRSDADMGNESVYVMHLLGGHSDWNPSYSADSKTKMTKEGNGWFSYSWPESVSFSSGEYFSLKVCADTAGTGRGYNNKCSESSGNVYYGSTFGNETEVWLYSNSTSIAAEITFTPSFIPPGSKMVWFKSPWGNKALPQMIFGADTLMMRFAVDDENHCGWFYGAVSPAVYANNASKSAYFNRYQTPSLVVPVSGVVDLAALASSDEVYVDGTLEVPTVDTKIGALGACFDSSRTLHVYSPWRTNTTLRDSAIYLSAGNVANNKAMSGEGEYKYWWKYVFSSSDVSGSEWKNSRVNFGSDQNGSKKYWHAQNWEADTIRPYISSFFPKGIYEAWVFTKTDNSGVVDVQYSPLEEKVVRLLSPWSNMSPVMIVPGDTIKMGPFSKDSCGWYQGVYYKPMKSWDVYFRQAFGFEYFTASGIGESANGFVSLDSIFAIGDTAWIQAIPFKITNTYPGRLGDCPTMKISAMVVDWAGESFDDSIDVDFGGIYDGNPYTIEKFSLAGVDTSYQKCQGTVLGMVQDTLVNGLPARVPYDAYPWAKCSAAHEIEKWFVPEVLAKGANGEEYTNAVCRDIELSLDEEGFWLADITNKNGCSDPVNPGFFPVDDFEYLDPAQTIKNPKNDKYKMHDGCMHNYSYAMKVTAEFQYVKGQYFEFRGDDDVWVYINNRLVVDIGGCHNPEEGAVNLDTLGLTEGETYPFHIFYSERNATGANFKMRTSINLQTQKTFYKEEVKTADGTIMYNLKQKLVDESLSCDVTSVAKVEIKDAASVFILRGGALPTEGVALEAGLNYGGILINEYMSGFTIDTTAIVKSRKLPSGSYVLEFRLATDQTQSDRISFIVPEYPLPDIAFADSTWAVIDPDTVKLGTYAFVLYPVHVRIDEATECTGEDAFCSVTLRMTTTDSLGFYDVNSMPIDSVVTDAFGHATFYVMSNCSVDSASFSVSGELVNNTIVWRHIKLEKPPVPVPTLAEMHDRDGDGVGDSLIVIYNDILFSDDEKVPLDYSLDTAAWAFGDSTWHNTAPNAEVRKFIVNDSTIIMAKDSLMTSRFTGTEGAIYRGLSKSHFTYVDSTGDKVAFPITFPLEDKIAPMISKAVVIPNGNVSSLTVYFTESLDSASVADTTLFKFKVWYNGEEVSSKLHAIKRAAANKNSRAVLTYSRGSDDKGVVPAVGDSICFRTAIATDLNGNTVFKENWVRIEGEQQMRLEETGVFAFDPSNMPKGSDTVAIGMYVVSAEKSFKDIQKEIGLPGTLIRFDIGEALLGDENLEPKDVVLKWENFIFSSLGTFVNSEKSSISCADKMFDGDCRKTSSYVYLAWNLRTDKGRLVGTGAYISKLDVKVVTTNPKTRKKETVAKKSSVNTFGVKREK